VDVFNSLVTEAVLSASEMAWSWAEAIAAKRVMVRSFMATIVAVVEWIDRGTGGIRSGICGRKLEKVFFSSMYAGVVWVYISKERTCIRQACECYLYIFPCRRPVQ
jgi:hypothetical protein